MDGQMMGEDEHVGLVIRFVFQQQFQQHTTCSLIGQSQLLIGASAVQCIMQHLTPDDDGHNWIRSSDGEQQSVPLSGSNQGGKALG